MIDTWMIGSVIGFSAGTAFGCWWKSLVNQALYDELSVLVGEKKRASSSALRQEPTGAFMLRTEPEDGLGPNGFQSPSEGVGG